MRLSTALWRRTCGFLDTGFIHLAQFLAQVLHASVTLSNCRQSFHTVEEAVVAGGYRPAEAAIRPTGLT